MNYYVDYPILLGIKMMNKELNSKNSIHSSCPCTDSRGLFLPNRLLSAIVVGLLFLFFASFITGYFFGKQHDIQQVTDSLYDNAFNDQNYASAIAVVETQRNKTVDSDEGVLCPNSSTVMEDGTVKAPQRMSDEQKIAERYRAALIGFSTHKAAQRFAEKLIAKGIEVEVVTRSSKTAKGQEIHWYQVITSAFDDKNELTILVNRLMKEEKLKDVLVFASQKINNTHM